MTFDNLRETNNGNLPTTVYRLNFLPRGKVDV